MTEQQNSNPQSLQTVSQSELKTLKFKRVILYLFLIFFMSQINILSLVTSNEDLAYKFGYFLGQLGLAYIPYYGITVINKKITKCTKPFQEKNRIESNPK